MHVLAIVVALLAVSLLIVVHEAGHYLAARRFGMRVERFSVGFGPVLLKTRRGDTEFALSALPFGGYVRIAGMAPGDGVDPTDAGAYANHAAWRRFVVILAGPATNYVAAIALAAALLIFGGLVVPDPSARVGNVGPGGPGAAAGLRPDDRVVSVAGTPVDTFQELVRELQRRPAQTFPLVVERGEGAAAERLTLSVTPNDEGGVGRIDVEQHQLPVARAPGAAVVEAFTRTNAQLGMQVGAFGQLFAHGKGGAKLEGPVGIAKRLVTAARTGAPEFLSLAWAISVVLAVLNLFPIPALDGGRLVFLGYEIVARRRVDARLENAANLVGAVALLALMVGVTVFKDLFGR